MSIPPEVAIWCEETARGFRLNEYDLDTCYDGDRDAALVEYALRLLANARDPITAQVLETIDRRRAVTT